MASLIMEPALSGGDPLDIVEQIVSANEWPYERTTDRELSVSIAGSWNEYHLHFSWAGDHEALLIACAFDCRVPVGRMAAIYELLASINARLWLGHFDVVDEEGMVMYRHGVLLSPTSEGVTHNQCENLIEAAINECERYFPAFQFVIWAGKTPADALMAAMLDTVGEA